MGLSRSFFGDIDAADEIVMNLYPLNAFLSVYMDRFIHYDLVNKLPENRGRELLKIKVFFRDLQEPLDTLRLFTE